MNKTLMHTITSGVQAYDADGNPTYVIAGSWIGVDANANNLLDPTEQISPLSAGTMGGIVIGVTTPPVQVILAIPQQATPTPSMHPMLSLATPHPIM
jgi:hypothetical protein